MRSEATIYSGLFGNQPVIHVLSPGRINFIGEHIDYYGGYVLPAAINRYISMYLGKSFDGQTKIYSSTYDEWYLPNATSHALNHWQRYILMASQLLEESGFQSKPFYLEISSDIPAGAGLSSSAALLCGYIQALNVYNDWNIADQKIAFLAQSAEHRLGTPCGLMDQYASLMGKKNTLLWIDFYDNKVADILVDFKDHVLLLINTMVHHELNDGGYAQRRKEGESALESLKSFYSKSGTYRDFTLSELEQMPLFSPTEYKRARHAITEQGRVVEFINAIQQGDFVTAGSKMYATHMSLKQDYEVSCEEADFIVEMAKLEGVDGARIIGGGFGGCVLCLMHASIEEYYKNQLTIKYTKKFGFRPEFIDVQLGQRLIENL